MNRWALLSSALFLVAACGGSTVESADGGDTGDAASADAAKDAPVSDTGPDTSSPFACGKVLCQGGEICVHPCCGGAPPACTPKPDGGTCPTGTTEDSNCGGEPGCRPDPCTPPLPYCSPSPTNCGPPPTGHDAYCLCA